MKLFLTEHQNQIIQSNKRYRVLVAGRRWGKTELAIMNLLLHSTYGLLTHPNYIAWYLAPTYKQAKEIAWEKLKRICLETGFVKGKPNESELKINFVNGSQISLKGTDNEDTLVGVGLNFAHLDEYSLMKKKVWSRIVRPMLSDKKGGAMFTGTPRGFNHLHEIWLKGMNNLANYQSWHYKTIDSPFIDPEEIEEAKKDMDIKTFQQEYEASFENMQGRVYYAFDRNKHVTKVDYIEGRPIILVCDFNVSPMKWGLGHYYGNKVRGFDELVMYDTNTMEMAQEINKRYPNAYFQIYGDYAGKSRTTVSYSNNYDIIKEILPKSDLFLMPHTSVEDSVNSLNSLFSNCYGDSRFEIDYKCEHTIKDLEQVVYKEGTNQMDKSNMELTHISDAWRYYAIYEFPINRAILTNKKNNYS